MSECSNINDTEVISLPVQLDHAACLALRPNIEHRLGQNFRVIAKDVAFLGGAGAELLLALQADCTQRGLSFEVQAPSEAFQSGLAHLGLPDAFQTNKGNA